MAKKKKSRRSNSASDSSQFYLILFGVFIIISVASLLGIWRIPNGTEENRGTSRGVEGAATQTGTRSGEFKDPGKLPCGNHGDVDGDGKTTEKDVKEILKHLQGLRPDKKYITVNADIDGDKKITSKDKDLLLKYIQHKITTLPICPPPPKKCTNRSQCPTSSVCEKGYCQRINIHPTISPKPERPWHISPYPTKYHPEPTPTPVHQ